MKVVINNDHGGFLLSKAGLIYLAGLMGKNLWFYKRTNSFSDYTRAQSDEDDWFPLAYTKDFGERPSELDSNYYFSETDIPRNDPMLVKTVEDLKEAASGRLSSLKIVEIPDDIDFEIEECNGLEWVSEKRRTWR